jgi:hypothetical protein
VESLLADKEQLLRRAGERDRETLALRNKVYLTE